MSEIILFIKRVLLIFLTRVIPNLKGIILLPVLVKVLGPSEYGVYNLIVISAIFIFPLITMGLPWGMVRNLTVKKDKAEFSRDFFSIFFYVTFFAALISLILSLFSNQIAFLLQDISISNLIPLISIFIFLEILSQLALQSFRTFDDFKRYSILTTGQVMAEILLISYFVIAGFGLWGVIFSLIIIRGVILLFSLIFIISYCGFSFNVPKLSILRPYFVFGIPLIPSVLFELIISMSDRFLIGFYKGSVDVGIYSASYSFGSLVAYPVEPVTYILAPTIFNFYEKDGIEKIKSYLSNALKFILMLCIPSVVGISVLAKSLLLVLTTPDFIDLGILIVPLIGLSMIFEAFRAIYGEILMIEKATKIFSRASIIAGSINIVLNLLFLPYFGIVWAAFTTLLSYVIISVIMFRNSVKYMKVNYNIGFLLKCLFSSLIMGGVLFLINPITLFQILFSIIMGIIIYFVSLFLLKGFSNNEIRIIINIFKSTMVKFKLL